MSRAKLQKQRVSLLQNFVPDASVTDAAVENFYESIDSPKSLACYLLYKYGEHRQLLELPIDPLHYTSPSKFRDDYCAVKFLSKSDFLDTKWDLAERAMTGFLENEEHCRSTNLRFYRDYEQKTHSHGHFLLGMRRKIDMILGEFDIEEFFDNPGWGPGVSTQIKGFDVSPSRKFQSETGITKDLYAHLRGVLPLAYPLWFGRERDCDSSFSIEAGNTVITVPKNSKIDRVIAVEPGLNLFFQKSAGKMMSRRLRKWSIDLRNQGVNQALAKSGSITNRLATVDFTAASDCISRKVVENLLPTRWFTVLDILRSKGGLFSFKEDGKEVKKFQMWEKFSSMGNGFTFELESLIFFVAALVSCEAVGIGVDDVSVFGDDVIIPTPAYSTFASVCDMLGFKVNLSKSYSTGSFRESCGSHYFHGVDVKPIFLRKKLNNAFSVFKLANNVRRYSHRCNSYISCDRRFLRCWRSLVSGVPKSIRSLRIPEGYGDGGLLSNFDEACPSLSPHGHEGFQISLAVERGMKVPHDSTGLLLSRLYSLGIQKESYELKKVNYLSSPRLSTLSSQNYETLRSRTQIRVVNSVCVPTWYDLGSWD